MNDDPACPACKKPWHDHDGIERTCWALTESRKRESALVDALRLCANALRSCAADHGDLSDDEEEALAAADALLAQNLHASEKRTS